MSAEERKASILPLAADLRHQYVNPFIIPADIRA